jgi:hypothetical protein
VNIDRKGGASQSLCENTRIFVGRSFSYGINAAKSERLQPLKYGISSADASALEATLEGKLKD